MEVNAINSVVNSMQPSSNPADKVSQQRSKKQDVSQDASADSKNNAIQPEELLQQIKGLTEDGAYSVRFENDKDTHDLIVKVVDQETDEVVRQIPPEELITLTKRLSELSGNIVDTHG